MTHDKENAAPTATPPPNLVPMDNNKKRKSSVKRVRFSLDKEPSPLRLNNDFFSSDDVSSRLSVAGRRSSVSHSPLLFPTQEDLLRSETSELSIPAGSPGADSRQSTGSSVNVLSTALNSFANVGSILQHEARQRSIWDTPSSSAGPKNRPGVGPVSAVALNLTSPKRTSNRASGETPGDERKLFGFNVLTSEEPDRQFVRSSVGGEDSNAPVVVVVNAPDSSPVRVQKSVIDENQDDPMLLTGASSVVQQRVPMSAASSFGTELVTPGSGPSAASSKSGGRRRRRRLSNLEEIESELRNIATPSPDRRKAPIMAPASLAELLESEGINIEKIANETFVSRPSSVANSPKPSAFAQVSDERLLTISLQQMKSLAISVEEMTELVKERLEEARLDLKKLLGDESVKSALASVPDPKVLESCLNEAVIVGKQTQIRLLETQHKNLLQALSHFDRFGIELEQQSEAASQLRKDCELLRTVTQEFRKKFDDELQAKYIQRPSGEFERRRSEAEVRLNKLDATIASHEKDILATVSEITEIENRIAEKQSLHVSGFNAMRALYLRHGWNVVAELQGSIVVVYSGCHLLVFEKARNNDSYWCLDRIVPCKFYTGRLPFYTPNLLNNQITFYPGILLQQLASSSQLVRPFRYTPQSLAVIMNKATTALCELIEIRESISRILTSSDSRVRINSNLQIEAVLVVVNTALGVEVPLMVKLLWFDPIFADQAVRYSNFSYIVTETLLQYFPEVKAQIEQRFSKIQGDPLSIKMLEDIVKTIHSVLIHAKPNTKA